MNGRGLEVLKTIFAGAALLLAMSRAALAATSPAPDPLATRRGFEVGAQLASYHYEEPNFAEFTGGRAGVVGAYTFKPSNRMFIKVDGRGSYGELEYRGSGTRDSVPDLIVEARGVVGMDFRPGNRVALSPHLGLGYRHLYNDSRGYTSTNAAGYRRYSNYLYAPLGLTVRFDLGKGWVLAPALEWDIFMLGKQRSRLSDTNIGFNDVTNTQRQGNGYRTSMMVEKDHLAFGAWMHYWSIEDSDVQPIGLGAAGLEPANWTREIGIEFRYRF
jgi:hypothetical protein